MAAKRLTVHLRRAANNKPDANVVCGRAAIDVVWTLFSFEMTCANCRRVLDRGARSVKFMEKPLAERRVMAKKSPTNRGER